MRFHGHPTEQVSPNQRTHFYKPVCNARYVPYSAPALAILIAAGIVALFSYSKSITSGDDA